MPASLSRTLTEIHQEGIRIPPAKLYRPGELDESLLESCCANVRMPEQNWGDLQAQIAAVNTGERKIHDMIAPLRRRRTVPTACTDLLDYAEAQARAVVRAIPDGDYFFADYVDEDCAGGYPLRLALTADDHGRRR